MAITYFNWSEIYLKSRKDPAAIIILAYAQTSLYNEIYSLRLMRNLNINHIPSFMFQARLLEQKKQHLVCNYKTIDPQGYFKNPNFLTAGVPIWNKVYYLRALSLRRLSDTGNKIPRDYFKTAESNLFMTVEKDYIYFNYEDSYSSTS